MTRPSRFITAAIALTSALVLAGCDAGPTVPWSDYAPTVKARIDQMATAKDCSGLQEQFDIADSNNDSTMSRIGHNNADLMEYINYQLEQAGCYS